MVQRKGGSLSRGDTSRMNREVQVRICEGLGVQFPGPTRQFPGPTRRKRRNGTRVAFRLRPHSGSATDACETTRMGKSRRISRSLWPQQHSESPFVRVR